MALPKNTKGGVATKGADAPAEAPKAAKPAAKPSTKPPVKAKPAPAEKVAEAAPEVKAKALRIGRKELAASVRARVAATGMAISPKMAEVVAEAYENSLVESLMHGAEIVLPGFGKFLVKDVDSRERQNPQNPQEKITVPAHKVPRFRPGKKLKEALNGSDAGEGDE